MKATVEFEVNGCHDCILTNFDEFEEKYCCHPNSNGNYIDECAEEHKFPEWCPLFKNKEERNEIFQ